MAIRLDDEARRHIAILAEETGVSATDCIVDDAVVFVVAPDDMATAIGTGGGRVAALEERLSRRVVLVEDAERPEDFVANALAPAAVYDVRMAERDDETVAVADVAEADVGVAIGEGGERVERARQLAKRHFDVDDIAIESTNR